MFLLFSLVSSLLLELRFQLDHVLCRFYNLVSPSLMPLFLCFRVSFSYSNILTNLLYKLKFIRACSSVGDFTLLAILLVASLQAKYPES